LEARGKVIEGKQLLTEGAAELQTAKSAEEVAAARNNLSLGQATVDLAGEQIDLANQGLAFAREEYATIEATRQSELQILDIKRKQLQVDLIRQRNSTNAGDSQAAIQSTLDSANASQRANISLPRRVARPDIIPTFQKEQLKREALAPIQIQANKTLDLMLGQLQTIGKQLALVPTGTVEQSISIQALDTPDLVRKARNAALDGALAAIKKVKAV
jgi:hypothetical protein